MIVAVLIGEGRRKGCLKRFKLKQIHLMQSPLKHRPFVPGTHLLLLDRLQRLRPIALARAERIWHASKLADGRGWKSQTDGPMILTAIGSAPAEKSTGREIVVTGILVRLLGGGGEGHDGLSGQAEELAKVVDFVEHGIPYASTGPLFAGDDEIFLEDETGRLKLCFSGADAEGGESGILMNCGNRQLDGLPPGVIISLRGIVNASGSLVVTDGLLPGATPVVSEVRMVFEPRGERDSFSVRSAIAPYANSFVAVSSPLLGSSAEALGRFTLLTETVCSVAKQLAEREKKGTGVNRRQLHMLLLGPISTPFVQSLGMADKLLARLVEHGVSVWIVPSEEDPTGFAVPRPPISLATLPRLFSLSQASPSSKALIHLLGCPAWTMLEGLGRMSLLNTKENIIATLRSCNVTPRESKEVILLQLEALHIGPASPFVLAESPVPPDSLVCLTPPPLMVCGGGESVTHLKFSWKEGDVGAPTAVKPVDGMCSTDVAVLPDFSVSGEFAVMGLDSCTNSLRVHRMSLCTK